MHRTKGSPEAKRTFMKLEGKLLLNLPSHLLRHFTGLSGIMTTYGLAFGRHMLQTLIRLLGNATAPPESPGKWRNITVMPNS
jgi:hypothetical protein